MLLRNDLLHYPQPSARTVRVLWIDPGQRHAYVYDVCARTADVVLVQLPDLLDDLRAGRASVLPADPYLMVVSQELLPPKYLQLRARAWQIIAALVAQEPDIYDPRQRGQMIARATAEHQVSHPTVYRYLRRYWQRGQTPNALLPDYCNSGGKGKVRQSSEGVKRGRPRKNGADAGPGVNADEEVRRVFRVAIARYAAGHRKFSRLGAYRQMLDEFFAERHIDPASGRVQAAPQRSAAMLPTFGQFNYWLDHDHDHPPEVARRHGGAAPPTMAAAGQRHAGPAASALAVAAGAAARAQVYPVAGAQAGPAPGAQVDPAAGTQVDPAAGTEADPAAGVARAAWRSIGDRPGASYRLDVVCADVQLVSRADRAQAIGRPHLYVVQDTYSGLVTGIHVGLGPADWPQAMLALAGCCIDKQRYCQQFGRRIEAAQWPGRHLPDILFAAAPIAGLAGAEWGDFGTLHTNFNLRCVTADHGPGNWQQVLARRFRLLAPELVQGAHAAGKPCRLDGVLDVAQLTRIVIDCILYYNNCQGSDGSPAPAVLWHWGTQHRGGALKTYPEHLVRCSLMPVAPALVGSDGLHFAGSIYTCARAVQERWYDRARQRGGWQVKVAYDPSSLDTIYLLDTAAPRQFHACHLADASGVRHHLSAVEMAYLPAAVAVGEPAASAGTRSNARAQFSFAG
ncbi:hypothetical protein ASF61_12785 [Duganella sp. Leaf126]|uniref:Mu transposase C-terminal domain-containing protein n=1 Tax=Duganella sp. Leaf126 TaxID=1736266 RepID=UPI0006FD68AC|nr:Mu transposase C-terminal domain-containing protein [Duganella sp. Leaf126]KQQ32961.1 hypothetical protein ASF61_12785 [Duganella sp. Leaf126]